MKSVWYLSFLCSASAARLGKHEQEAEFANLVEVVEESKVLDDYWAGPTEQRRKYVTRIYSNRGFIVLEIAEVYNFRREKNEHDDSRQTF